MSRIALIFDFDDTLTHDSTSQFIEYLGLDAEKFWKGRVQPLDNQDWDPIPAYMFQLLELSKELDRPISREELIGFGKKLKFHKGVTRLFARLKADLKKNFPDVGLEFYIISSGIGEIIRNCRIAPFFTECWGSEFHYDARGNILFPKKVISFTDKTRYIFQISKGIIGEKAISNPFGVNEKIAYKDYRIKIENMVFVGDGLTDIPCFSLIKRYNGIAFAVYDPKKQDRWGKAWDFIEDGRVSSLYSANYSIGSDLSNSLQMAISRIARRITEGK